MSTTGNRRYNGKDEYETDRGSKEIQRDIERTRDAMDRTLDAIGDRLHPRHLVDGVLDLFRGDDSGDVTRQLRSSSKQLLRKVKRNPVPALLVGAAVAYMMMDDDDPRHGIMDTDDVPRADRHKTDAETWFSEAPGGAAAWHDDYDWSDADNQEPQWTSRAESTLQELNAIANRSDQSVGDRVKQSAHLLLSISGRKRSEIQRALRAQWDDLPEHSGSFVDARTGKPYDDSYGRQWRELTSHDLLASDDFHNQRTRDQGAESAGVEDSWSKSAEEVLQSVKETLSDQKSGLKDKLRGISSRMSSLAEGSHATASDYGTRAKESLRSMRHATKRGVQSTGESMRHAGASVRDGYSRSRDYVSETMEEYPLAAGAAVFGIGLLLGGLTPRVAPDTSP